MTGWNAALLGQAEPTPTLSLATAGGNLQVSWPASATDWVLCSESSLATDAWIPVAGTPVVSGGMNVLTMPQAGAAAYYQLRHRGAVVPFTTYEAETTGTTTGTIVTMTTAPTNMTSTPELEASGRGYVALANTGDYWQMTVPSAVNGLTLRHCIPDASGGGGITATLSLYVNGVFRQSLTLSSRHNWLYGQQTNNGINGQSNVPTAGTAHVFWDETRAIITGGLQPGDVLRLEKDAGDTATFYRIDCLDLEAVPAPLLPPAAGTYLSVADFGSDGTDALDDTTAIQNCITAAKTQGKSVWIPAGTYYQSANFTLNGLTVQGAGMWYTQLVATQEGAGTFAGKIGFLLTGSGSTVTDLAIDDDAHTFRDTSPGGGGGVAFSRSGTCTNWRVENVWITHAETGFWMSGVTNGVIRGCRVRNTYADAINLNSGTSSTLVENNHVRGNGDDGTAILSEIPTTTISTGNTLRFNTVCATWWGHNCDLAGGGGHLIEDNYWADNADLGCFTINQPGSFPMHSITSATIRRNSIVRGGGDLANQKRGAVWIAPAFAGETINSVTYPAATVSGVTFSDNLISNAIFRGIHLTSGQNQQITFLRNVIDHPGFAGATSEAGIWIDPSVTGAGTFTNNTVSNLINGGATFYQRQQPRQLYGDFIGKLLVSAQGL